jgi:hypothetical protein
LITDPVGPAVVDAPALVALAEAVVGELEPLLLLLHAPATSAAMHNSTGTHPRPVRRNMVGSPHSPWSSGRTELGLPIR